MQFSNVFEPRIMKWFVFYKENVIPLMNESRGLFNKQSMIKFGDGNRIKCSNVIPSPKVKPSLV